MEKIENSHTSNHCFALLKGVSGYLTENMEDREYNP